MVALSTQVVDDVTESSNPMIFILQRWKFSWVFKVRELKRMTKLEDCIDLAVPAFGFLTYLQDSSCCQMWRSPPIGRLARPVGGKGWLPDIVDQWMGGRRQGPIHAVPRA